VCGAGGRLSWTHIPPQSAGNIEPARSLVLKPDDAGSSVTALGHEKQGGAAGYFLCAPCNNDAGNWYDTAYADMWQRLAVKLLRDGNMPSPGGPHLFIGPSIDPGAVVRSILSGMMALNPRLRTEFPVLQDAVQHRQVVRPPDCIHLLLALNPDRQLRVAGGGADRQDVRFGRVVRRVFVHSELAWTPLYLVLTDATGKAYWDRSPDILPWLLDAPGYTREVNLLLPVLTVDQLHGHVIHQGARRAGFNGPNGEMAIWAS